MKSKRLLLTLLLALLVPWAANGQSTEQQTQTCYPPTQQYATGYTDGTTLTSGEMHAVTASAGGERGWMMFDVSSIPDNATINSISLSFYCTSTSNCYVKLTSAGELNPTTASASELYSAIGNTDPNYYTSTYMSGFSSTGWKTFNLSNNAISNLQSNGITNNYFTLGFYEYESGNYYLYASGYNDTNKPSITVTYTVPVSCPRPSKPECSAYTATTASITWTENGEANAWVLQYGMDSEFETYTEMTDGFEVEGTSVTADLQGLTTNQTYYARVKAICEAGVDESAFSDVCDFIPSNTKYKPFYESTSTNYYVPLYGYYNGYYQKCEMVYPATALTSLDGKIINSLKFHSSTASASLGSGYQVFLKVVDDATISAFTGADDATVVYEGELSISDNEMLITFEEGSEFEYNGGNLLIGLYHTAYGSSSYTSRSWYSQSVTGAAVSGYNYSSLDNITATVRNYLPMITVGYVDNPYPTPKDLNVTAGSNPTQEATISWTVPAEDVLHYEFQYKPDNGEWTELESTNNAYASLSGLNDNTWYTFQVQAIYENGESSFASTRFQTEAACPAPVLSLKEGSETAHGATLSWTGTSDSYILMVGEEDIVVNADFETGDLSQANFTTTTASYPWTVVANTHSGAYCAKSGNCDYGNSTELYNNITSDMVLEVTLTQESTLTFSAKVSSESGWDKAYFSIDGTVKINAISGNGSWIDYSYTLAAGTHTLRWYYTKDTSGFSNDDCFYVDDIVINMGVSSWDDSHVANASPYTFTDLNPETTYQVKVVGVCPSGNSDPSNAVGFTTLVACFAPSGLTVDESTLTTEGVTVSWTPGTTEQNAWQIALSDVVSFDPDQMNEEDLITVTGEPTYPFTGLDDNTTYYWYVRANCGDEGYSAWTEGDDFTTIANCLAPVLTFEEGSETTHGATVNWTGNADSYIIMVAEDNIVVNADFETNDLSQANFTTTTASYPWTVVANDHSGAYCAKSGNSKISASNTTSDMVLEVTVTEESSLTFSAMVSSESGCDKAYFSIDGTDQINGISGNGNWIDYSYTLAAGPHTLRWYYSKDVSVDNNDDCFYVDDILIVGNSELVWDDSRSTAELTYTFTDLDPETTYQVKVMGVCPSGNSDPSNTVGFTTLVACHMPTNLTNQDPEPTSVELSWVSNGEESAWQLCLNGDEEHLIDVIIDDVTITEGTVTYTLAVEENTPYTVKVRANCGGDDGESKWSIEILEFTTPESCPTPVMNEATNIGHYTANVSWTDASGNTPYTVSYRVAGYYDVERTEDFSGQTPVGYNATGGELPNGWYSYNSTSTAPAPRVSDATNYNHGGMSTSNYGTGDNFLLLTTTSNSQYAYAIMPQYSNLASVSFDYVYESTSYGTLSIGYVTDNTGYSTYQVLQTPEKKNTKTNYTLTATDIATINANNGYIAFRYESGSGTYYAAAVDNIAIAAGNFNEGGVWNEVPATAIDGTTASLSGLTIGTKYDVKVAVSCGSESETVSFTTVSENQKYFLGTESEEWLEAGNWEPAGAPTYEQTAELRANVTITGEATAKTIDQSTYAITIEDGGKLKTNSSVNATVKKNINAWTVEGSDTEKPNGYYLIANPMTANYIPNSEGTDGILVGAYDLYSWDYTNANEWSNFKANAFTYLNSAQNNSYGYLYANAAGTTLTFEGNTKAANVTNYYRYCSVPTSGSYDFPGVYLLGNGFVCDAYLTASSATGNGLPCYKMNEAGDGFTAVAAGEAIAPLEGVFFVASSEEGGFSGSVYVTTTAPQVAVAPGELDVVVSQGRGVKDNAIIVFGDNQKLGKFSFREGSSKIYIPMEGKDYAVVNAGNVGEMPVNFKAEKNGSYTLSFTSKEVSFSYLHLIDNMTGADVNLLETPSYSFNAQTTDYESRFRLVFATGSSATGDNFGFINGMGNLCIFGIDGTATVQVVDVTGRMLSSETFSGSYERKLNVAPGVYMIRLINGNDVKVQKMIVR